MALDIYFYTFNKKLNSTKQPDSDSGTLKQCVLKESTSINSPTLVLKLGANDKPAEMNYAYIPEFKRYYYINDWYFQQGLWIATLTCDVLASFKSNIGFSTQYIARSSYTVDMDVMDSRYPTIADVVNTSAAALTPLQTNPANGAYIVGILGSVTSGGVVTYYKMSQGEFLHFAQMLTDPQNFAEIIDVVVSDPIKYVVSCEYFPHSYSTIASTTVNGIKVGWWTIDAASTYQVINVSGSLIYGSVDVAIPRHPQATRGNYLNVAPYARYALNFQPFGYIPLDTVALAKTSVLHLYYTADLITGYGRLRIQTEDSITTQMIESKFSTSLQLAQLTSNATGIISGVSGLIANIASGNVMGSVAGIMNASDSLLPQVSSIGTNGGIANYAESVSIYATFIKIADENLADIGRPVMQNKTIRNIPGYIQCVDAHLSVPAYRSEVEQIISMMEGGFYYE